MRDKYLEKQKEVFVEFMDLEKANARIYRLAMWKTLRMCGVGGKKVRSRVGLHVGGNRGMCKIGRKFCKYLKCM
jgi:hypothetical protein